MSQSRTMRAAFYQGARTFKPGTAPVPVPTPREALLRVRRVGICGTDLHIFQGHLDHRVPKGGIIGHETFAEIVQPPQWSDFKAGDRVVVEPLSFCGKCRACRMGASYICYDIKVLGVDLPGGMQEYWTVPGERLLRIPDTLADDHAALVEPLAVATHDVRRAGVKADDSVLVFGGGPIGTLIGARVPGPRRPGGRGRAEPLPARDAGRARAPDGRRRHRRRPLRRGVDGGHRRGRGVRGDRATRPWRGS